MFESFKCVLLYISWGVTVKYKRTLHFFHNIQIFHFIILLSVHRIGRTGRSGKTGIATTFINKANDESVLLDLKHLLMEAKQKVPPFLAALQSENEKYLDLGGKKGCQKHLKCFLCYAVINFFNLFLFQMREVAAIVVVLATGLQTVQNWKPYRTNKRQISAAETIWQATLQTIDSIQSPSF